MSALRFRLPSDLPDTVRRWLPYAYLVRGAECVPLSSTVTIEDHLLVFSALETRGAVSACVPWLVGQEIWMLPTTTLLPGPRVYELVRELARAQLHRVRSLVSEWQELGLTLPAELHTNLRQGIHQLLTSAHPDDSTKLACARHALHRAMAASQALTLEKARLLAQARQQCSPVPFYAGWSAETPWVGDYLAQLRPIFHGIQLAFPFDPQACEQESYWRHLDTLLRRIQQQGWQVSLGPFFDFASARFYELWRTFHDENHFLEKATLFLSRVCTYAEGVHDWYIAAAINFFPTELNLEAGMSFLSRLLRPVKRFLTGKRVSVGLAQPWGEQAHRASQQPIPLLLADWLSRADLGINTLEVELIFGCEPRGSFLRSPWSIRHLFDWFADNQLPLHLNLGLPASVRSDSRADPPDQEVFAPASEDWQAAWASALLDLALAHPDVQRITWCDVTDAVPHLVPNGGLFDEAGQPRRVLQAFRQRCPTVPSPPR
ncbi:MAG: hypothetical protein NZM42_00175 [Gemmatales bacterium]|nr:hypothetical protein [Gemmatales bacterium]MDW8221990.1 hypothetical protein [Gemmatales bacterium]